MGRHSMEELRDNIESILSDKYGYFDVDEQGDYQVEKKGFRVFVTPIDWGGGDTLVRIWTIAAYGVKGKKKLLAYLNDLNRRSTFGSFFYKGGLVYVHQTMVGNYLDKKELTWTIKGVAKMAKQVDKFMVKGFGGTTYDWSYDFGSDWYYKPYSLSEYEVGYAAGGLFMSAVMDDAFRDEWGWAFDGDDGEYGEFAELMDVETGYMEEANSEWEDEGGYFDDDGYIDDDVDKAMDDVVDDAVDDVFDDDSDDDDDDFSDDMSVSDDDDFSDDDDDYSDDDDDYSDDDDGFSDDLEDSDDDDSDDDSDDDDSDDDDSDDDSDDNYSDDDDGDYSAQEGEHYSDGV